jgi:alkanesulfonate monooxygenase SsuD/methylene tetrahydromethanopterin reductase-like flavin-dependent oxidoreductase (luciferase family)
MDEAIDIVQGLSAGGYFEYHGEAYDFPPLKITPTPTEPLPILVGGHATPALRRAARSDGWLHGGGDPADLPGLLDKLGKLRQEEGTADRPFEVHVISVEAFSVDGIHRLEEQGVTDVIVGFRWPYSPGPDTEPLQTKLDNLRRFADDVMAKVRS